MSRVSRAQAEANHRAIEDAASKLFRERGLDAVSIADIMGEAGLTHGGFYGHFPSKDALAARACEAAFGVSAEKWQRRIDAAPSPAIAGRRIAESYLSTQNRNPSNATCPTATLAADVARAGHEHPIRTAYVEGVRQQVETLAMLVDSGDPGRDRAAACVQLATMMGALLLARAAHGDPLGDEIVGAVRAHLVKATPSR